MEIKFRHFEKKEEKKYFGASIMYGHKVVMLIGSVGSGKSTLVNALIHNEVSKQFLSAPAEVSNGTDSKTKQSKVYRVVDRQFAVIDTPGWNDRELSSEQIMDNLYELVRLLYAGVDIIVFCKRMGRFTPQDKENFELIQQLFGEEKMKTNAVYCMTHSEDVVDVDDYLKQPDVLREDRDMVNKFGRKVATSFETSKKIPVDKALEEHYREPSLKRVLDTIDFSPKKLYVNMGVFDKFYASLRSWWHAGKEKLLDMKMVAKRKALWLGSDDCSICLEPIINDAHLLVCGHLYHFDCFSTWHDTCLSKGQKTQTTCPQCRRVIEEASTTWNEEEEEQPDNTQKKKRKVSFSFYKKASKEKIGECHLLIEYTSKETSHCTFNKTTSS